jgi:hypothetical protein
VHAGDAGGAADPVDDAADDVPVQRAAVVRDQALAVADVLQVAAVQAASSCTSSGCSGT